jgi:hypothetical protein
MFLYCFNVLISKIIKKKLYFNIFLNKEKTLFLLVADEAI